MPDTIKLGAREMPIRELTLGDMRKIGIGTAKAQRGTGDPAKNEEAFYESTFEILALATGVPQPELEKITGSTLPELLKARRQVIVAAGLMTIEQIAEAEDKAKGEAKAAG